MKGEMELQVGDQHAGVVTETDPVGFCTMEEEDALAVSEREIWLQNEQDDLLGVNDASMFYADFPPLPDFPCMSSSSSSSSTAAPVKTITCSSSSSSASSSSAASWAVLKSDAEEDVEKKNCYHYNNQHDHSVDAPPPALSSTASMEIPQPLDHGLDGVVECLDVMENFGYMDLLESNDFLDPASIFQIEENPLQEFSQDQLKSQPEEHAMEPQPPPREPDEDQGQDHLVLYTNNEGEIQKVGGDQEDEMSTVFLEWLKSNKDSVSANDLRNVKLKKATIECAARRLGGGKEAMKQLLKLILEWVQTSHLQNKRRKENTPSNPVTQFQDPNSNQNQNQNTNPSSNLYPNNSFPPESNTCFNQSPWISPPPYETAPAAAVVAAPPPFPQPILGYVGDPYSNGASNNINGAHNSYPHTAEYPTLESARSWPPSQFPVASHYNQSFGDNNLHPAASPASAAAFAGYGNQYTYQFFHGPGDRLTRLGPSTTKEARKKRMQRQRRYLSHHRCPNHHHGQHHQNQALDPQARLATTDSCTAALASHANPANWLYWPSVAGGPASAAPVIPAEPPVGQQTIDRTTMQTQNYHQGRVSTSDRRQQGWKQEKNLRFLLQKVLKQSDVGNLGRIVLPKKEAETHLPELEARDGISIAMEDIGTSRVWNMRYRYWPNNKSRMYLLENTGDFVRANGLQEGDFIVLYSDVKCGKFMIRGVKVRQTGAKPEPQKKAGKSQKNQQGNATATAGANYNGTSSSSPKRKNEKAAK